jgi:photosystem II stability/assembly factor-like uncharacterized protein
MTAKSRPRTRRRSLVVAGVVVAALLGALGWWQFQSRTAGPSLLTGDFHSLQLLPGGRLLYGQHEGVSVSVDGGRSWSASDGAGDAMALSSRSGQLIMAGHDVFRISRDGGSTWQNLSFGTLPGTDIHGFAATQGAWYANIAGRGLYRSQNQRDWQFVSGATGGAMTLAAGPGAYPRLYALTMQDGLIISDNGTSWQRASDAPQAAMSGLDVHPVSGDVYLAGPAGVARSRDRGATWENLQLPEGALLVTSDPANEQNLYAAGESGRVYRSLDGGTSWSR